MAQLAVGNIVEAKIPPGFLFQGISGDIQWQFIFTRNSENAPLFLLPDLIAIDAVVEKKSEIGIKLEIITDEIKAIFQEPFVGGVFYRRQLDIVPARVATFCRVDGPVSADEAFIDGALGNLTGGVPTR